MSFSRGPRRPTLTTRSRPTRGSPVVLPWFSRGSPVVLLWFSRGSPVVLPWFSRDSPVVSRGSPVVLPGPTGANSNDAGPADRHPSILTRIIENPLLQPLLGENFRTPVTALRTPKILQAAGAAKSTRTFLKDLHCRPDSHSKSARKRRFWESGRLRRQPQCSHTQVRKTARNCLRIALRG